MAAEEMNREEQYIYRSLEDFQRSHTTISNQALNMAEGTEQMQTLQEILRTFDALQTDLHSTIERTIREHRALAQAIDEESTARMNSARIAQRAEISLREMVHSFMGRTVWKDDEFELTAYDIAKALFLLVIGYFVSALLAKGAEALAVRKKSRARGIAGFPTTARRVTFYTVWLLFFMVALDSINVPLTAFAFVGGSLALAIGFGAQDICRNLISGLIITFNRPFKQGDIVDVDNLSGKVQEIGARSTLIRTFNGVEVFVPNSYFIANKVVNHTKTGPMTRQKFTVLVSSSADPDAVEEILTDVVQEYGNPRTEQRPLVALVDVTNSTFKFDVYYWLDVQQYDWTHVEGNFRKQIFKIFKERGIAFS